MTPETIAIITVGVGLGGLMLTLFQFTIRRIDSLERRIDSMDRRIDSLQNQESSLSERLARLEGLMEAIRDMLTRSPATP
jgi:chaperonin cofactor prefoldin